MEEPRASIQDEAEAEEAVMSLSRPGLQALKDVSGGARGGLGSVGFWILSMGRIAGSYHWVITGWRRRRRQVV